MLQSEDRKGNSLNSSFANRAVTHHKSSLLPPPLHYYYTHPSYLSKTNVQATNFISSRWWHLYFPARENGEEIEGLEQRPKNLAEQNWSPHLRKSRDSGTLCLSLGRTTFRVVVNRINGNFPFFPSSSRYSGRMEKHSCYLRQRDYMYVLPRSSTSVCGSLWVRMSLKWNLHIHTSIYGWRQGGRMRVPRNIKESRRQPSQ